MSMILDGTNGATFNDGSLQAAAASPFSLKNRIINGDMVIDQRNAGASVALTGSSRYAVDRFISFYTSPGGAATAQQSSVAPSGFNNSLLYSVTTGASIINGDYNCIQQNIEGFNVADLVWGTASARTVTLSFWVRSSLTGTFGGSLVNSAGNRSYVYTYTISAANTWEYKTITIAGDTSGTWLKNNGTGISVYWNMGFQSGSLTSTTNTWLAGSFTGAVGNVTPSTTTGATFYITGVQLERNTTATPFEWIPYGMELMLCQRYYQTFGGDYAYYRFGSGQNNQTITNVSIIPFVVPMRASPTMSYSSISHFAIWFSNATYAATNVTSDYTSSNNAAIQITVASGLTLGGYGQSMANNTTSARLNYSAEL